MGARWAGCSSAMGWTRWCSLLFDRLARAPVGALSHFIEREGVATTSISLIREHSEYMKPPRALWVSFYLGRPFGVPDDADFQRDVLRAALNLLPTVTEHSIVDYPVDAPEASFDDAWACPISFEASDADTLSGRLRAEVQRLAPWWQETNRARGRSLIGGSGGAAEQIETMAAMFAAVAEGAPLDAIPDVSASAGGPDRAGGEDAVQWGHRMPYLVRHLAQDLRSFYWRRSRGRWGRRPRIGP